jgi:hypothetical protein
MGEKLVRFGASFDGPGLVSAGTVREFVEGTDQRITLAYRVTLAPPASC